MFKGHNLLAFLFAVACIAVIIIAVFMTDYSHLWWVG